MEAFVPLIWIGVMILLIASSAKKAKLKQAAQNAKKNAPPVPGGTNTMPAAPKEVQSQAPVRFSGSLSEGTDPCHESDLGGPDRMRSTLYGGSLGMYTGSLGVTTEEGYDPCHEEQADIMTVLEMTELPSESAGPAVSFNWSGNEIMKAVVMQEILKRPCERTLH